MKLMKVTLAASVLAIGGFFASGAAYALTTCQITCYIKCAKQFPNDGVRQDACSYGCDAACSG